MGGGTTKVSQTSPFTTPQRLIQNDLGYHLLGQDQQVGATRYRNTKTGQVVHTVKGIKNPQDYVSVSQPSARYPNDMLTKGVEGYKGKIIPDLIPQMQGMMEQIQGLDASGGALGASARNALGGALSGDLGGYKFNPLQSAQAQQQVAQTQQFNAQQFSQLPQAISAPGQVHSTLNDAYVQNYFQNAVAAPMMRNFDTQIAPRLNEAFAGQGASFSSRRGYAQQQALTDLNTQMGSQLAQQQLAQEQLRAQQEMQGGLAHNDQTMQASEFNNSQSLQNSQFNAGQGNQIGMQNAQMGNQMNQFNAAQGNQMGEFNAQAQNQTGQFNSTMDANQVQMLQNARQQQMQAGQQADTMINNQYNRVQMQQGLLSPFQQRADQQAQSAYQQWAYQQPYNNPWLQLGTTLLGTPWGGNNQTQQNTPSLGNMIGQGVGMLQSAPQMINGVSSGVKAIGGLFQGAPMVANLGSALGASGALTAGGNAAGMWAGGNVGSSMLGSSILGSMGADAAGATAADAAMAMAASQAAMV